MSTLYRKYRPQKFSDIFGQEHLVQTLANEISSGRVAHAYLFSGPRGIGKTTMARLLAKAVNCEKRKDGDFEPCNQCSSCLEIATSRNIDVIEIDAASHTGVDNVRENIIDNAQFKPTRSKYKVFIVDEAHMLSTSAFNALLKTLEEPPAHVIFILATTEYHKLPATIISRCQRFNFKKISEDVMLKKLESIAKDEGIKIDADVLKRVATKSEGCMRDAESLLGQLISLNLKKIKYEDAAMILPSAEIESVLAYITSIAQKNAAKALETIDTLIKEGVNLDEFALTTIEVLRSAMIAQTGSNTYCADFSEKDRKQIREISELFAKDKLVALIDAAIKRRSEIKISPVPQLPLELLAVEFAGNVNPLESRTVTTPKNSDPATKNDLNKNDQIKQQDNTVTTSTNSPLNLDEVRNLWPDVITRMSENFPSLAFVLKMAEIAGVENDRVNIVVPYSFHREKIEEKKCLKAIENIFSDLLGKKTTISCFVKNQDQPTDEIQINNLAAEFGGEVIA